MDIRTIINDHEIFFFQSWLHEKLVTLCGRIKALAHLDKLFTRCYTGKGSGGISIQKECN